MILFADISWQPVIAYALIGIAAVWLVRRVWKIIRRGTIDGQPAGPSGGCAGCSQKTSSAERPKAKPLVQLDRSPRDRGGT